MAPLHYPMTPLGDKMMAVALDRSVWVAAFYREMYKVPQYRWWQGWGTRLRTRTLNPHGMAQRVVEAGPRIKTEFQLTSRRELALPPTGIVLHRHGMFTHAGVSFTPDGPFEAEMSLHRPVNVKPGDSLTLTTCTLTLDGV